MHLLKLILLFSLCIWMSAQAQTPYDSFAPETSRPILTSEALSKEKCAQDFSSDTTLFVAMIDTQQERILLMDMSDGSIVAYAPLTDNKCHWLSPDPLLDKYPYISPYAYCHWNPMRYVDPDGRDTVNLVQTNNMWHIKNISIANGHDVFNLTFQDGKLSTYAFSDGEYGKRINCLNIENTGNNGYTLGVYHVSGAKEGGTGFYVTPGGSASNEVGSNRRLQDGTYPINTPHENALWRYPGIGGEVVKRGVRFHYGNRNPVQYTKGCFVLFPTYTMENGNIKIELEASKMAAINFSYLLGGVGCNNYINSKSQNRIGVFFYPFGIQDRLILKSF